MLMLTTGCTSCEGRDPVDGALRIPEASALHTSNGGTGTMMCRRMLVCSADAFRSAPSIAAVAG